MAPILPGLSDDPVKMAEVVKAARDAGATAVWTNVLYLRPGTREHFLENLARDWPELLPAYEQLYDGRAYVAKDVVEPVKRQVRELGKRYGIADRRPTRQMRPQTADGEPPALVPPGAEQLSLATAIR
jgi:DNA repair photolyase